MKQKRLFTNTEIEKMDLKATNSHSDVCVLLTLSYPKFLFQAKIIKSVLSTWIHIGMHRPRCLRSKTDQIGLRHRILISFKSMCTLNA